MIHMNLETRIKPISYLKAHSADLIRELGDGAPPLVITQNGEAKAVLQDVGSYEATQESLALLKLLALGRDEMAADQTRSVKGLGDRIRGRCTVRKSKVQVRLTAGAEHDLSGMYRDRSATRGWEGSDG